jgi:putative peptide zinc metalloprotease protein
VTADRTTFHESWYRVAGLHPSLRTTVQTRRQHFRGRRWHVVQDASNNQYFRLDDAAYHLVSLLDGRRTVEHAWRICQEQLGDGAPTQGEAIQLLGQLYTSNLLQSDLPSDAAAMLENARQRTRRQVTGFLTNVMFMRIPLMDPDAWLDRWERVMGPIFAPVGMVAWLALMAAAVLTVASRAGDLVGGAFSVLAPGNLFLLYAAFVVVKALHELGHAVATKRIGRITGSGGEVHTVGLTMLVLTPVPYVDASSAWAFRSKWHRALVGAAGMYVELGLAAVAAIVWANTSPGTVHALAYNVIFVASISTLLFNGNPLLRFDGYYILSDVLELPNLAQRSKTHLHGLVKRHVWGLRSATLPAESRGEWWWLPAYAIAAMVYRVVICVGIILFVADKLFFLGTIMAAAAVVSWMILPAVRFARYVLISPELSRVRPRAVATTAATILLVLGGSGLLPLPDRDRAEGVVEPVDVAVVYVRTEGFVDDVLPSGAEADPQGAPLMVIRNIDLETHRRGLVADRRLTALERDRAAVDQVALAQSLTERIVAIDEQIAQADERLSALAVRAPIEGRWIAPDVDRLPGAHLERGDAVGVVASVDRLLVRAVADQSLGPRIGPEIGPEGRVEIRVHGRPDLQLIGRVKRVMPAGSLQLPSAALGYRAGGATQVVEGDEDGTEAIEPFFEVHIELDEQAAARASLCSGQRVDVRFEMPARPLLVQWWRAARQLVQRRFQV